MTNGANKVTPAQLRKLEPLAEVPEEQLQWLIENSIYRECKDGDIVFKAGDPIKSTDILLKGKMRIYAKQNGNYREISQIETGQITGYLPFSRVKEAIGDGQCTEDAAILSCPDDKIKEATTRFYELTEALVHIMTSRVREYTALQQQNEKMISLGKLSAGLAHELNNPASAITRSAESLQQQEHHALPLIKSITTACLTGEQATAVIDTVTALLKRKAPHLTLMQRSDREDELQSWLQNKAIHDNTLIDALVTNGVAITDLDKLSDITETPQQLSAILNWFAGLTVTNSIINDISESSKQISELVNAVKTFTYMDQATDRQFIDIHKGIISTLTVLRYKMNKANIAVTTDFDTSLPEIEVLPGELNQVWTNLIDNAIDAMQPNGKGSLHITTNRDHQFVQVKIADDGTGIPEDIQNKVFDPFFSTKEMGKGTGLGLDLVMQVMHRHNGTVKVNSVPGETVFTICFPIKEKTNKH